jgi:hypothetical protein
MRLGDDDRAQVRAEVEQILAEYRANPTAEQEDRLGLRIATLPAEQREQVPAVLLEIVAAEAAAGR